MKRIIYFFYYLRETDWNKFNKFLEFAHKQVGKSYVRLVVEATIDVFRFNISLMDYFYFRFFNKDSREKLMYAGTGYMYEFQLKMNPVRVRDVLADKIKFLRRFKPYVSRGFVAIDSLMAQPDLYNDLLNHSGKLVLKGSRGQVGAEIEILEETRISEGTSLVRYMKRKKFDLVEEYVEQHQNLMELSPSGLNTIRIVTQLENNEVVILAARLRITIDSHVDNMAAGNVAAPIDLESGIVRSEAVFSDITKGALEVHPITGVKIIGFRIPFWKETLEMVKQAAQLVPENRSVGWDIAISSTGPQLIEGNHNWCKLLWQLPVGKGLKSELDRYWL